MIFGLGTDVVVSNRIAEGIARFGPRFLNRIYTPYEQEAAPAVKTELYYAMRWAAKEAFVKALGTGFAHGIGFRDIEVQNLPSGAPRLNVSGRAREILDVRAPDARLFVSLSDDPPVSFAVVVIELPQ